LDPDVAKVFKTPKSVNEALRSLAEWRLLKLHVGLSTVSLSFLIVGILSGYALFFVVLIAPVLMEPDVQQFHTALPGRSLAIALLVASQGPAQKLLSHESYE